MGLYATTTTLETLWGGASFTDITSTASTLITQAENEINKRISKRYDISSATFQTSTSIPPMITTLCEWLSLGYLYENQGRGSIDAQNRADRYIKKAMDNLMELQNYEVNLLDSTGSAITESATDWSILSNQDDYHTTFNEDDELNWSIDSEKLDDISDERD